MTSTLDPGKQELLAFLQEVEALQYGSFTLKSGRISPYFFNTGQFRTGPQIERLGVFYAAAIARHAPDSGIIFGPAYKGIPLCVSTAMALTRLTGREIGYLFNRKEEKDHGDQGVFVGRPPEAGEGLVLVDDVITDGVTKHEAVALLRRHFAARIEALVIAFDRMERDPSGGDAVRWFEQATGIPVISLLSVDDLERSLAGRPPEVPVRPGGPTAAELVGKIREYRRQYGTANDPPGAALSSAGRK